MKTNKLLLTLSIVLLALSSCSKPEPKVTKYLARFFVNDEVYYAKYVEEGTPLTYDGPDVVIEDTRDTNYIYHHDFVDWDNLPEAVTEDVDVHADIYTTKSYTESLKNQYEYDYTVNYFLTNGKVSEGYDADSDKYYDDYRINDYISDYERYFSYADLNGGEFHTVQYTRGAFFMIKFNYQNGATMRGTAENLGEMYDFTVSTSNHEVTEITGVPSAVYPSASSLICGLLDDIQEWSISNCGSLIW